MIAENETVDALRNYNGYRFGAEFVKDSISEALPLIEDHFNGLGIKYGKLEIDREELIRMDDALMLRVFSARENETEELSGYCLFYVRKSIFMKNDTEAHQLAFFVKKESRGFGIKFLKYCDEILRREGINTIYQYMPYDSRLGVALERMGYDLTGKSYSRRLTL